jgi:hypothetical protein
MALVVTGSGRRRGGLPWLLTAEYLDQLAHGFEAFGFCGLWRVPVGVMLARAISVSACAAPAGGLRGCGVAGLARRSRRVSLRQVGCAGPQVLMHLRTSMRKKPGLCRLQDQD